MDAIGGITIPNYDDEIQQLLDANTVWVAGTNCVAPASNGAIGVGSSNSALPICPN
jgi:hypothetical protein